MIFPNYSRSFDTTRDAIRFWGYDSAMEFSFFVTRAALKEWMQPIRQDEAALLAAFDANRDLICATAARIYAPGRKSSYVLDASDF
jgi:Protein of unknown function (DUF1488)